MLKKPYEKPALYAESFRLVEHISSLCAGTYGQAKQADALTCVYMIGDEAMFYSGSGVACTSSDSPGYDADFSNKEPFVICYNGLFNGNETQAFAGS